LRRKTILTLIIAVLLCISIVNAFEVQLSPKDKSIYKSEFAEIYLTITNEQNFDDQFWIMPIDNIEDFSSIRSDPAPHYTMQYGIIIPAHSKTTTTLIAKPRAESIIGLHDLKVKIKSKKTGELVSKTIFLNIEPTPIPIPVYETDVDFEIEMNDRIDPSKPFSVKLNVKNNNLKTFDDVEIKLHSKLVSKETVANIDEKENKLVAFTVDLDPKTPPQKETIIIDVYDDGELWQTLKKDFEIVATGLVFEKDMTETTKFLKTTRTITLKNTGNALKSDVLKLEKRGWLENLLSISEPKYEKDESYYLWDITLEPDEEITIVMKTSHRPIFWLIIAIIIICALYLYFRDPLVIRKTLEETDRKGDEVSKVKIRINIKNRSGKTLHNVRIIEKLPHIVRLSKDHQPGTLIPEKIYKYHSGNVVKWVLKEIEPHEERILIYELKPLLKLIGSFEIKPTVIEFHNVKGRKGRNFSNRLEVV
jgi:hypothetical protein